MIGWILLSLWFLGALAGGVIGGLVGYGLSSMRDEWSSAIVGAFLGFLFWPYALYVFFGTR